MTPLTRTRPRHSFAASKSTRPTEATMFSILFIALLAFLVWHFRKPLWTWLNAQDDPLSNVLEDVVAEEKAVFGKREVPSAASKNDPGVAGGPKL